MKNILSSISKSKEIELLMNEHSQRLEEISNGLIEYRNIHLENAKKFYENLSCLKNFKEKPPKLLMENMEKVYTKFYTDKISELSLIIIKSLDNLMVNISNQIRDINDFDSYFLKMEDIYEDLIDYHKDHINVEKENLRLKKTQEINNILPEFQKTIRSKDDQLLINFLNENVPRYQILEPMLIEHFENKLKKYQFDMINKDYKELENCIKFLELINTDITVCKEELKNLYENFSKFISLTIKNITKNIIMLFEFQKKHADILNCKRDITLFFAANELFDKSQYQTVIWKNYDKTLIECIDDLNKKWSEQKKLFNEKLEAGEYTAIIPLLKIYRTNGLIIDNLKNGTGIRTLERCNFHKLRDFADCLKNLTRETDIENEIRQRSLFRITEFSTKDYLTNMNGEMYQTEFAELKTFQSRIREVEKLLPTLGIFNQLQQEIDEKITNVIEFVNTEITNVERNIVDANFNLSSISIGFEFLQIIKHYFSIDDIETSLQEHVQSLIDISRNIKKRLLLYLNDANTFIEGLKNLKNISITIPFVTKIFNNIIDELLDAYKENLKEIGAGGQFFINFLGMLKNDKLGNFIIDQHKLFDDCKNLIYNLKITRKSIEDILGDPILLKSEGYSMNDDKITTLYKDFERENKELIDKYITDDNLYNQIVINLNDLVESLKINGSFFKKSEGFLNLFVQTNNYEWHDGIIKHIPSVLSKLFAIYTLMNSNNSMQIQEKNIRSQYLFLPHCSQVLSILLMLGCNIETNDKCGLQNNFVQIGTGQGKSITLAIVSVVLALFGFNVYCSNYSINLSDRDFQTFKPFFERLGVSEFIYYSTFNQLCEKILNEDGDIRLMVEKRLLSQNIASNNNQKINKRPKVLLIDELDVFLALNSTVKLIHLVLLLELKKISII